MLCNDSHSCFIAESSLAHLLPSYASCADTLLYCKVGQKITKSGCEDCESGSYNTGFRTSCTTCPPGHYMYKPGGSIKDCSACFPGTYESSRTSCSGCPEGRYSPSYALTSAEDCLKCPPGRYSDVTHLTHPGQCKGCPKGRYGRWRGLTEPTRCNLCPTGRYGSEIGSRRCTSCPRGRYQNREGVKGFGKCKSCPAGQYSAKDALESCTQCPAGRYSAAEAYKCSLCPPGRWSQTGMKSCSACDTCPDGHYQSGCFCLEGTARVQGGGGPWEGRVQIYTLGIWRPVCAHGFDNQAATLVCQSLGYSPRSFISKAFGLGEGPVKVRRALSCEANTTQLSNCITGAGPEFCPKTNDQHVDAGVICCHECEKQEDAVFEIEASHSINGTYKRLGSVAALDFSYQFYSAAADLYLYQCLNETLMWVVAPQNASSETTRCPSNAIGFTLVSTEDDDSHEYERVPHSGEWAIMGDSGVDFVNVHVLHEGDINLVSNDPMVDAIENDEDTPDVFEGRLEIFHAGEWGSVCNTGFTEVEASVACVSLGFEFGGIVKPPKPKSRAGTDPFDSKQTRFWMDQVRCQGNEKDIQDCEYLGWGNHNCARNQEVEIVCRTCRPELCSNKRLAECQLHGCATVSLRHRKLTGEIPKFFHWEYLKHIDLTGNLLVGTLPDNMHNWHKLESFQVAQNGLTGPLTALRGTMTHVTFFNARDNRLTGSIPSSLSDLKNIRALELGENAFTGTLPASLSTLKNLEFLELDHNRLTGTVPSGYDALIKIDKGNIKGNSLTGAIPTRLAFAGVDVGSSCHPHRHGRINLGGATAGVPWCFAGSVCEYTCPQDYIVSDGQKQQIECFRNESWAVDVQNSNIKCKGKSCKKEPVLSKLLMRQKASVKHCVGTSSGKRCSVKCPETHVLHDKAPSFRCWLGEWQPMPKAQRSLIQCLQSCGKVIEANMHTPFTVENADLSMCEDTPSFLPNNEDNTGMCKFKCHEGYVVRKPGEPVIQCVNGLWKQTVTTAHCTPEPCRLSNLDASIRTRIILPKYCDGLASGKSCRYQCDRSLSQLPYPTRPAITCSHGIWQLGDFSDEIRCVKSCLRPPPQTLLKNAKVHMCKETRALDHNNNFNGSCMFECIAGMRVLPQSGIPFIRCEIPVTGGPPKWVKIGDTGECTSDLCSIDNEHNVVHVQNFDDALWQRMYVPKNVDAEPGDVLDRWTTCADGHKFEGTLPFRVGCCQKVVNINGTATIVSGLFPLNASGTCPRIDDWASYRDKENFYNCVKVTPVTTYIFICIVVVTILGVTSGGLVVLIKFLFGRKDVYRKIQKAKTKIAILSSSKAGRRILTQISGNYKTTKSYKRGFHCEKKKFLTHAQDAIGNFQTMKLKTTLKRKSSMKHGVVPLCVVEKREAMLARLEADQSGSSKHENAAAQTVNAEVEGTHTIPRIHFGPKAKHAHRETMRGKQSSADAGKFPEQSKKTQDTETHILKDLHEEAQRLRAKNAARVIQRKLRAKIMSKRCW